MATRRKPAQKPSAIPSALRNLEDRFLECRLQHAFRTVGFYRSGDGYTRRRVECDRCGAIGKDTFTALGVRAKNRQYQLPVGYTIPGGVELPTVRREVMRRATIFSSEEEMLATFVGGPRKKVTPKKATRKAHPIHARTRPAARAKSGAR